MSEGLEYTNPNAPYFCKECVTEQEQYTIFEGSEEPYCPDCGDCMVIKNVIVK